jgi:hypothetical protein
MTTKSIPEEIAELRAMDMPSLVSRYEAVFGRAPRVKHREWLWKRIAWRIQELRFGGLSTVAKRRLDELISEIDLPLGEATRTVTGRLMSASKPGQPTVGTTLVRSWRGREIRVQVLDNGFEHDGIVYKSLSAVAGVVTQTHWNGRLFVGLKGRKRQ